MVIKTATDKQYPALWAGISTIDNALRFEIKSKSLPDIMAVFSDPAETVTIRFVIDNMSSVQVYENYTDLLSVGKASDSTIVVSLQKP